jgi:multiple sugar transport system permease protein
MSKKLSKQFTKTLLNILMVVAAMVVFFPVFWMLTISFRNNNEVFTFPPRWIPQIITIQPYLEVLASSRYLRYFLNSYVISIAVTILSLVIGIFAAYGFSRFDFRGNKIMNLFIVATQTVPKVTLVIPYFIFIVKIQLYDTYLGLILTFASFTLPYAVLMLTGYYNTIPKTLDESVIIDGGSRLVALWRVIVPITIPAIISTGIYTFILAWNEFLFALTLTKNDAMRTVPVGIALLKGETSYEWNVMMAISILGSIPVLLLFIFAQKYYVSGLTSGAVKG